MDGFGASQRTSPRRGASMAHAIEASKTALRFCRTTDRGFSSTTRATMQTPRNGRGVAIVAERVGFEPTNAFWTLLEFQSSAFDHSATSPDGGRSVHGRSLTG